MEPLPPELRDPFSVAHAASLGIPVTRLRRKALVTPYRGVRMDAPGPFGLEPRCRAYAARMPDDHYFSHLTAARLWELWLPTRFDEAEPLHVTVPHPGRAPRIPGVVGHHIDAERAECARLRGLPVATPLEAVRTLAPSLGIRPLVVLLDSLRRRGRPLVSDDQLLYLLAKHGGQRGVRRLRVAFDRSRAGSASAYETRLRLALVDAGLPEPEVNVLISRPGRRRRYGDLVLRSWGVVVEYEGEHHQGDRGTYVGDIARYEELASDWRFVRVAKEHLADIPAVVRRIHLARCQ